MGPLWKAATFESIPESDRFYSILTSSDVIIAVEFAQIMNAMGPGENSYDQFRWAVQFGY